MSKSFKVIICNPCNENWDNMHQELQGKYCDFCKKTVIDFTLMTDGQIIEKFKNSQEKICGRFYEDQLNRKLEIPLQPKWYMSGMWKVAISSFLLIKGTNAIAQLKPGVVITANKTNADSTKNNIKNNVVSKNMNFTIQDESTNETIPNCTIEVFNNEKTIQYISDKYGSFKIPNLKIKDDLQFTISCVGYKTKTINNRSTLINTNQNNIIISLEKEIKIEKEVIVKAAALRTKKSMMGSCITVESSKFLKKADLPILPTFNTQKDINIVEVFPNPIFNNEPFKISYISNSEEVLNLQIVTITGKTILTQKINAVEGNNIFSLQLPTKQASQNLFLQITNSKGKQIVTTLIEVL